MLSIFKPYDVFISFVAEDREIVEALYERLSILGLKVWYSKKELHPGEEIRPAINKGLRSSRYGIAVISPSYESHWAQGELFYLMGKKTFIPVLHGLTAEETVYKHPEIITRYCLNTNNGVDYISQEIVNKVQAGSDPFYPIQRGLAWMKEHSRQLGFGLTSFLVVALLALAFFYFPGAPNDRWIEEMIKSRAKEIENAVQQEFQKDIVQKDASASSLEEVIRVQAGYTANTNYYRNKFDFYNGIEHIKTVAGIKNAGVFPRDGKIEIPFGLSKFNTYLFKGEDNSSLGYVLVCLLPLKYQIIGSRYRKESYEVDVRYTNFLRYAEVNVTVDPVKSMRISSFSLIGAKPLETFVFEKKEGAWLLSSVR